MKIWTKYTYVALLLGSIVIGIYFHYSGVLNAVPYEIRGVDVSAHQGEIDWNRVANEKITFAYIKATEADDFKDKKFTTNWKLAGDAGIVVGAYHYYSLAYGGEVQARNFIDTVSSNDKQLPPVVDLEYGGNSKQRPSKENFQKELGIYMALITKHYGREPMIYTTDEFYHDYLYPEFQDKIFWRRSLFSLPKNWTFWQYSQWGLVDGIGGRVDLNFFRENKEDFDTLFPKQKNH